jgi:hypothetical protein
VSDETRSYSDAELAELDLAALLGEGISGAGGALRPELQGIGSAAAAVQLDNQLVTSAQVADAAAALQGRPASAVPPPALDHVVRLGLAGCRTDADRALLGRWLGMIAGLLILRERSRVR